MKLFSTLLISLLASSNSFAGVTPAQFAGTYKAVDCTTDSRAIFGSIQLFPFSGDEVIIDAIPNALNVTYGGQQQRVGGFNLQIGKAFTVCGPGAQGNICEQHAGSATNTSLIEVDTALRTGGEIDRSEVTLVNGNYSLQGTFTNVKINEQNVSLSYSCKLVRAVN